MCYNEFVISQSVSILANLSEEEKQYADIASQAFFGKPLVDMLELGEKMETTMTLEEIQSLVALGKLKESGSM